MVKVENFGMNAKGHESKGPLLCFHKKYFNRLL